MLHRREKISRAFVCIIFLRIYKMLLYWFLFPSPSTIASCFILHLVNLFFAMHSLGQAMRRRVNKINSMLLGLVHTLKCLVLWFLISHFVFTGLPTCYDLCFHIPRVIKKSLAASCASVTSCIESTRFHASIFLIGVSYCWKTSELHFCMLKVD